ncbi:hypothetical protein [Pontibacter mangrovi]|uniref:Uncharacterized protein n=1 Tax=Pontibacter mangrovi TaxID=2589816 RepID=A0A501WD65_9BACT|nr:hypothetical protein [Pontibacter mangrovi]TPE46415.1 hypothetical protein FJM65_03485 [Pontibacter mangrovi]
MKKFLLLIAVALVVSCSTDEEDCCTIIDTGVSIKYLNGQGENLLEVDGGIDVADINIYHKINNDWVKYFRGNLDYPKGFYTVERENGTYLVVFPSTTIGESGYSETKIEFSETDFDILKTEVQKKNSSEIVTMVWYNDELKWEGNQSERLIEVVK